jgi:hypothetical protein
MLEKIFGVVALNKIPPLGFVKGGKTNYETQ